jgi:hypothetical protein
MAFLNDTYTQDSVRRAMRGQTPPFLPPELETPTPPPPPLESPETARYRELVAQGAPEHPKHGKLRTVLETIGKVYGVNEEITDPGYTRDRDSYYEKLAGAKEAATIAEKEARLAADLESERARKASYEATAEARRASMNQPPKLPAPPSTYEARLVRDLDSPDPAVREAAQKKLDALKAPAPPKLTTPIPGRDVPYSPEVEAQRRRMAAAGRAPRESGDRPASPAAFRIIESEKARNLRAAERDARNRIADGEDEKVVYTDLESQKDEIQNAYEAQIVAAGGSIAPQAPKPAPTPQPTPQPAPQQTPKQLTVEKAAEYLRKAGGNKDLAREMARKDGWNF